MPHTIKTKGGPSVAKDGGPPNGSDKKARSKYALDAGALLDGILSETHTEARAEEKRINQELQAKQSEEQRKTAAEADVRRRQAEAALAAERDRQDVARSRRQAVLRTMQDLEAEKESGSLAAATAEPMPAEPSHRPIEFEHQGSPISQSYSHHAIQQRRSPWLMVAVVAGLVVLLGGGATAFLLVTSEPAMDPSSYPKVTPSLASVTRNALVVVNLREIPRPEPEPVIVQVQVPAEDAIAPTAERSHGHGHGSQQSTDSTTATPLDLSLDGGGIFDRGSE